MAEVIALLLTIAHAMHSGLVQIVRLLHVSIFLQHLPMYAMEKVYALVSTIALVTMAIMVRDVNCSSAFVFLIETLTPVLVMGSVPLPIIAPVKVIIMELIAHCLPVLELNKTVPTFAHRGACVHLTIIALVFSVILEKNAKSMNAIQFFGMTLLLAHLMVCALPQIIVPV